jgi:hypothetical protein
MTEKEFNWEKTTSRFIAYFDIMGFKDMVQRSSHEAILGKLESLKKLLSHLENVTVDENKELKKINPEKFQTRSVTFSDSIIFFSKGDKLEDLQKITADAYTLLQTALIENIGIKGALAFGQITVDFEKFLFFGQPIIDAYLLHEEIMMYGIALDCTYEAKLKTLKTTYNFPDSIITSYRVPLKNGKATHKLIKPYKEEYRKVLTKSLQEIYHTVSGRPRIYIDNTLDFLESLSYVKKPISQKRIGGSNT